MGGKRQIAVALTAAALITAIAAGCGGGGSSASAGSTSGTETSSGSESKVKYPGNRPTGAEALRFGEEAGQAEREAASLVVEENLKARAAGEWAKQCAGLSEEQADEVKELTYANGKEESCPAALRKLATPVSKTKALRADNMGGPVYALHVGAGRAFAFYHGKDGKVYAMALKMEGGEWKVEDLTPTELPEL
jgi:hypothetical protein